MSVSAGERAGLSKHPGDTASMAFRASSKVDVETELTFPIGRKVLVV